LTPEQPYQISGSKTCAQQKVNPATVGQLMHNYLKAGGYNSCAQKLAVILNLEVTEDWQGLSLEQICHAHQKASSASEKDETLCEEVPRPGDLAWARVGKASYWPSCITPDPDLHIWTMDQKAKGQNNTWGGASITSSSSLATMKLVHSRETAGRGTSGIE